MNWGIDLGGTKIEGAILDADGRVAFRERIATEASFGYAHVVGRVAEMVGAMSVAAGSRPDRIGVGTPGAVRPDGTMKNCNTVCLNGQPLPADLTAALRMDVVIANDADCFALAEARLGAGRGYRTVFGVILGTGVGGGVVVDGQLLRGPNGLAGEWGHTVLEPGGRPCYCGRCGCVEKYLSGPAIEADYLGRSGRRLTLSEIGLQPDSDATETVADACGAFGRALATVVNVLDPDVIVLGGGAGRLPQWRTLGVEALRGQVFGPDFVTPVIKPELGDSAGVIGACLLV